MECVFCKIIKKELPSQILFENDKVMVFKDIDPKADVHFLIIPKKHIESLNHPNQENNQLISSLIAMSDRISKEIVEAKKGYKLIFNVGQGGGQIVKHLHLHFLAGKIKRCP